MAEKKTGGEKIDWLEALEGKVREATGRLKELGAENERLVKRVKALEKEMEKGDGGGSESEEWEKEREEIRGRVERLTETLEGLLDE